MKTSPECLPCILSRVLETAARVSPDPWLHKKVMLDVVASVADGTNDFDRTPAEVASDAILRASHTINADPFAEDRRRMNESLLAHLPALQKALGSQPDPLVAAGRLAVITNDVRMFASNPLDPQALVADAVSRRLAVDDFGRLKEALKAARRVVYILDHAGEIVADKLLIEAIGPQRVTAVVRRKPLMRDALEADAQQVSLGCLVTTTGSDLAGVSTSLVSTEFRQTLERADVVIAKGEANFQTLEEGPKSAFYLFVARCGCTAKHLGKSPGDAFCLAKEAVASSATRRAGSTVRRRA